MELFFCLSFLLSFFTGLRSGVRLMEAKYIKFFAGFASLHGWYVDNMYVSYICRLVTPLQYANTVFYVSTAQLRCLVSDTKFTRFILVDY